MLDRLPPEILDAILVLTYPPSPWPDTHDKDKERRQSLRSLSLVSKATTSAAQALLWRKVVLFSPACLATLAQTVEDKPELGTTVRTVRVKGKISLKETLHVLRRLPGVRKVQCAEEDVEWEDIARASHLSVFALELHHLPLHVPVDPSPIQVVRLSLLDVAADEAAFERFLQPTVLPSLRALELSVCIEAYYFPPVTPKLASQLGFIHLRSMEGLDMFSMLLDLPTLVLVTINGRGVPIHHATHPVSHLRLLNPPIQKQQRRFDYMFELVLRQVETSVRPSAIAQSLHLPSFFHTLDPQTFPLASVQVNKLLQACTRANIDVFWHDEEWEQASFPKVFWAYSKRLKAKAAEEANEA